MPLEPHHVGINVADLDRSLAFYEALGFRRTSLRQTRPDLAIAFLALGPLSVELFAYTPAPPAAEPARPCLGFRHLALRTDDIERDAEEFKGLGLVPEDAEIEELPNGMRLLFFPDPDGVELELLQEP